jgi:Doubled CXXCH motif (Paired_CXXCH_1)
VARGGTGSRTGNTPFDSLMFLPPSFHPIEGPGRNTNVPGLITPQTKPTPGATLSLTVASTIYCSDCHASESGPGAGGSAPREPHGSSYLHILERNPTTADNTIESPEGYALCYKCHDRTTLLSGQSNFKQHRKHVVNDNAPCTACHAWHGVSLSQGNATNNAHLIDFDVSIVKPSQTGLRQYTSNGSQTGNCSQLCHGHNHNSSNY